MIYLSAEAGTESSTIGASIHWTTTCYIINTKWLSEDVLRIEGPYNPILGAETVPNRMRSCRRAIICNLC